MMNNKIKELAHEVGLGIQHNGIVLTKDVNSAAALEQFAQLIVRECVAICESGTATQTTSAGAAAQIKLRFGVQ